MEKKYRRIPRKERKFLELFMSSDVDIAQYIAERVVELKTIIDTNYREIPRLVIKAKILQMLVAGIHIDKWKLAIYFYALIKESKKCKKNVFLMSKKEQEKIAKILEEAEFRIKPSMILKD